MAGAGAGVGSLNSNMRKFLLCLYNANFQQRIYSDMSCGMSQIYITKSYFVISIVENWQPSVRGILNDFLILEVCDSTTAPHMP